MLRSKKQFFYGLVFFCGIIASTFLLVLLVFPASAHAEPLYSVLKGSDGPSKTIKDVWGALIQIVNYFVMGALVFVAFMNILRLDLNTYAIKKILPAFIMAVILANFSYLICRFFVDIANVVSDMFINSPVGAGIRADSNQLGIAQSFNSFTQDYNNFVTGTGAFDWAQVLRLFVLTIFEFAGTVLILILAFLFYIRNYVIYFLVAISPIAFMATALPMAKNLFNQWWSNFMKWCFMPIVSLFWLWMGNKWIAPFTDNTNSIMAILFAGVCYYLAITTPFKMGGAIMGQWGKLGKQAWGLTGGKVTDYGKRKTGVWWAGQAENGKWYNPLGHIARAGINMRDAKAFDEERIKNSYEGAQANMMRNTRSGRNRTRIRDTFGGEIDKARTEVLGEYYDSNEGMRAAEKKARWQYEKGVAEDRLKRALGRGNTNFAESDAGQKLMVERETINQDALKYEEQLKNLQTETTIKFLNGLEEFNPDDNPEAKKLLDDRILAMTRNLWLGEALNKSQQDRIDEVMQSQMHLHNMSEEIQALNGQLSAEGLDKAVSKRITDEIEGIDEKIQKGTATAADRLRKTDLRGKLGMIQAGRTDAAIDAEKAQIVAALTPRRDEIVNAARAYYQQEADAGRGDPLQGMVDMETTDLSKAVPGFRGLAVAQGFPEGMGSLIMTRTGKLTSIQVKGDIDKYLGEKTVDEIADDLNPERISALVRGKMKLADGSVNPEAVIANYREGKRFLNDPQANREIEGRMLALAQVAKQTSNADSSTAAARLASMMNDNAANEARVTFNKMVDLASATNSRMSQYRISDTATPDQVRSLLQSHMTTRGNTRNLAYSAVMRQPSMGVSNNPGNYLSTAQPDYGAGNHPNAQNAAPNSAQMATAVVAAMRANPDLSYSKLTKALGSGLGDISRSTDDLKTTLLQSRTKFAADLSKQMGLNLRQELRPAFAKALAELPRNASADQIAGKIQEVTGSTPSIDPSQISGILHQANTYSSTEKAIQLLSQTQNVADHHTYIQHFSNMTPAAAQQQLQILTEARSKVENIDTPTPEMLEAVTTALQKTGFAPQQGALVSGPKAIDSLFMAQQAAEASLKAYDPTGKFDLDKANDALAERFIQPEQAGNATPISERPGLHQDITPPAAAPASEAEKE